MSEKRQAVDAVEVFLSNYPEESKGVGELTRHINVRTFEKARNPAIKELITAAWTNGTNVIALSKQNKKKRMTLRVNQRGIRPKKACCLRLIVEAGRIASLSAIIVES